MCIAIALTIAILISAIAFHFYNRKLYPEKILSVYSQPGKWYSFKYLFILSILTIKKIKTKWLENYFTTEEQQLTNINDLEKPQALSDHDKAFDAVFFHGVSMDDYYFCGGTERRHEGKTFGLLYLVIPGIGLLGNEKLPSTLLVTDIENAFAAEGMCFAPVKPMKHWKIIFKGKMKSEVNPLALFEVQMEANWTSDFPYFFYETDINNKALARAVAKEEWTKEYFEIFKEAHQKHYEQMGHIKGVVHINAERHEINMMAFRDHSFGYKRDWSLLHRYAFHIMSMSDESRIAIGVISNPSTMSHLEVGYIVHQDKSIDSIESCDLKLYQHGENGTPGKDLAFTFWAGGKTYVVRVLVQFEAVHYKGHDKEARLIERFITCDVNGVKGRGISEWHYNNLKHNT